MRSRLIGARVQYRDEDDSDQGEIMAMEFCQENREFYLLVQFDNGPLRTVLASDCAIEEFSFAGEGDI